MQQSGPAADPELQAASPRRDAAREQAATRTPPPLGRTSAEIEGDVLLAAVVATCGNGERSRDRVRRAARKEPREDRRRRRGEDGRVREAAGRRESGGAARPGALPRMRRCLSERARRLTAMFTAPQSQHRKPLPLSREKLHGAATAAHGASAPPRPAPPCPAHHVAPPAGATRGRLRVGVGWPGTPRRQRRPRAEPRGEGGRGPQEKGFLRSFLRSSCSVLLFVVLHLPRGAVVARGMTCGSAHPGCASVHSN